MRIKYNPCDLSEQFPIQIDHEKCFLELNENHLIWSYSFIAEEPVDPSDKKMGLHQVPNACELVILKKFIVGVEASLTISGKRWSLVILVEGIQDPILYFKKETDCKIMQEEILKWLYLR